MGRWDDGLQEMAGGVEQSSSRAVEKSTKEFTFYRDARRALLSLCFEDLVGSVGW